MSDPATLLGLKVTNKANGQPVVYIGVSATLGIQLINATGADLAIPSDGLAQFSFFFPDFYKNDDIAAMRPDLAAMPGWTAKPDGDSIVVTYRGKADVWSAGQALGFSLANVATSATKAVTDQSVEVTPPQIGAMPPVRGYGPRPDRRVATGQPSAHGCAARVGRTRGRGLCVERHRPAFQPGDPVPHERWRHVTLR